MTIETGARLGPYEILGPIGAGGMGEVYRARDTRLGRDVAVKVLPAHMSSSAELRQRLEREAKTISQLSHPHICTLHDVGHQNGTDYLVMEFLEGETLADRLAKGALPMDQALKIGIEIAGALDAAHRSGIVHRDLKPGNVMLTKSGVKLLDFGLAKLAAPDKAAVSQATSLQTALQESQPLTTRGTILGTFQYMAPEQLEGGEADARSDIFSFGCVLYEMLTGQKAFTGKSQASLIGSIMNTDPPPISSIQPMIPPALDRIVKGCLAKDPEHRWSTAHDVMLQLQWIAEGGSHGRGAGARRRAAQEPREARLGRRGRRPARRRRPRLRLCPPRAEASAAHALRDRGAAGGHDDRRPADLSRREDSGVRRDRHGRQGPDLGAAPERAHGAAPSGHGRRRSPLLVARQPLRRVRGRRRHEEGRRDGRASHQDLRRAVGASDGSWSPEGVILFDGTGADPIYRVAAAGGTKAVAVGLDAARKETSVGWPEFLPDGKHFLYLVTGEKPEDSAYWIGSIDSKEKKMLAPAQTLVTYSPPGYLLFVRDKTLVAQPFDAKALKTTGEPIPLAEKIGTDNVGLARFSVSRDGVLVYRTGDSGGRLLWRDRAGRELDSLGDQAAYTNPALSPAGDRLAFNLADPRSGKNDIWVRDLARGVNSRFTLGAGNNFRPLWSPDGGTIVFSSDREGTPDLYEKSTRGQGGEKLLLKSDEPKSASAWTRDGRYIGYTSQNPKSVTDIWVLPTFGDRKPIPVLVSPFLESQPMFSPDGRFVAYVSNESGAAEIYVQTFPDGGGKWQVSSSGGVDPSWRGDGKELYYRSPDQKLMAVEIRSGARVPGGHPAGALSDSRPVGHRAQQVHSFRRRPALPVRRAPRRASP